MRTHHRIVAAALATCLCAPAVWAQNPIASKVVGSDIARRNRKLIAEFRSGVSGVEGDSSVVQRSDLVRAYAGDSGSAAAALASARPRLRAGFLDSVVAATAPIRERLRGVYFELALPSVAERRIAKAEVDAYVLSTSPADTAREFPNLACVAGALGARFTTSVGKSSESPVLQLERLCAVKELRNVVPEALRLSLRAMRDNAIERDAVAGALNRNDMPVEDPAVTLLAWSALTRVLRAVEKGHTNPQRWYLGGQLGLKLAGDGDPGLAARASVRASYFIPISPFQQWQLPVVTNIRDLAAAPKEEREDKLKKITTASEGAFLSLEPTSDPWIPGGYKDIRLQPFLAIGGQLNTLRSVTDTTKNVQFAQGRFGVGSNMEIGIADEGRPSLFLSSRVVWRVFGLTAAEQAFGSRLPRKPVLESFALVPVGGGTSVMGEVTAGRGLKPVVRVALWVQATPQKATEAK